MDSSGNRVLKIRDGCFDELAGYFASFGLGGKLLLASGSHVFDLYGKSIVEQLSECGRVKVEFVEENAISRAFDLAERAIATDVDVVVGLGGGKVVDVAKYAAFISKRTLVSLPTTAANDGLVSPIAVLKRKDGLTKSLGCKMPEFAFIDPKVILAAPPLFIHAGIGDTVSNIMALHDWQLACDRGKEEMNDYAFLMSRNAVESLLRTGYKQLCPGFVSVLLNSMVLSGIAMAYSGTSRPVSGSEHCFSHALDRYCDAENMHGLQTALGTVVMLRLTGRDDSRVVEYLRRFDVDVNPAHLGIGADDFVHCLQVASTMRPGRYTSLDEADLDTGRLQALYDELLEVL